MDAAGLRAVLEAIADGRIRTSARERPEPSVFAHEILNANPYAFLDDAPLEERRTRAVALRRGLPAAVVERIGGCDPAAVAAVVAEAQPDPRDADELHDLLLDVGALPEAIGGSADGPTCSTRSSTAGAPRASTASPGTGSRPSGVRVAAAVWPDRRFTPDWSSPVAPGRAARRRERAGRDRARPRGADGPTTADAIARALGVRPSDVEAALARLEMDGAVLRGRFLLTRPTTSPSGVIGGCSRASTAACSTGCAARSNRSAPPTSCASCSAGSTCGPGSQLHGQPGLARVIADLQGSRRPRARGSAPSCPRAVSATIRRGWTRCACRAASAGAGSPRVPRAGRPAARRRSRSCAGPTCPGCSRPTPMPPDDEASVAGRARRAWRSSAAPAPASRTRSSPAPAACARRSRTRWASSCPRAA
jgi:ATP-dependent Lhr-like helicase